jgi:hypothetical protein
MFIISIMLVGILFSLATYAYILKAAKHDCKHYNTCPFSLSCQIYHPEHTPQSVHRVAKLLLTQEDIDVEYKKALKKFVDDTETLTALNNNKSKLAIDL